MSELIKHECGIALIRLKKDLSFYHEKHGSALYGLNRMQVLMQKMHNRGQDGAGLAAVKLDMKPGKKYIYRRRSAATRPIQDLFNHVNKKFTDYEKKTKASLRADYNAKKKPINHKMMAKVIADPTKIKKKMPFAGEVLMGHLRYGTHGKGGVEFCHPVKRASNWKARTLLMAGNFNLTNVDELFEILLSIGQHPIEKSDTVTVLEKFGHYIDANVQGLFNDFKDNNLYSGQTMSRKIENELDLPKIITNAASDFDGGYVMGGIIGHGDAFVLRDPNGIRPAWYYDNEDITVVASERVAIQTAFNLKSDQVKELQPANAIVIKKNGEVNIFEYTKPSERKSCSFERIYFSRGNDRDIYNERLQLGSSLTNNVLTEINNDINNAVFTFIPNTAEVSFYGLMKGVDTHLNHHKRDQIRKKGCTTMSESELDNLLAIQPRVEKILIKDQKMRTFITNDNDRDDLVGHVYDITYGKINRGIDTLVAIDDSIVRGTTLQKSILAILGRLEPKKIVIVSSAPQIRYPDCYGIDMAKLKDFIAFRAMRELLIERGKWNLWNDVYQACKQELKKPNKSDMINQVQQLYNQFTYQEVSDKIAELITPKDFKPEVKVIYQTVKGLHKACPNHLGDWYFTGNYPTPGGNRVVNLSFVYAYEGINQRAY